MKRQNYYQVHKNKKPKIVLFQKHKYVRRMLAMAQKSFHFRNSLQSLIYSMNVFSENVGKIGDEIKMVTVYKPQGNGPSETFSKKLLISIDSGGVMI